MALLAAASLLAPLDALAGYKEGKAAYDKGNFAKALDEWRPLAQQGDARSQKRLADMYAGGEGVNQDFTVAAGWYAKAAGQGLVGAQNSLGLMYETGQGVSVDPVAAVGWYRKSAAQKDPAGQFALGAMYQFGRGVPLNKVVAYALFNQSPLNRYYAEALQSQMTEEQAKAGEIWTEKLAGGDLLKTLDGAGKQ